MKTTYFYNADQSFTKMAGMPRHIEAFNRKAQNAEYIVIEDWRSWNFMDRIILAKDHEGQWVSPLSVARNGYERYILKPKQTMLHLTRVSISEEEGLAIINAQAAGIVDDAEAAIAWCDPEDMADEDGRYWLSAYRGAGVYRLIVADGMIKGALYGGYHDCHKSHKAYLLGDEIFKKAVALAVEKRLGTKDFKILKADGSGTYFYMRDVDDAQYLSTNIYAVPAAKGGLHLNIEIK